MPPHQRDETCTPRLAISTKASFAIGTRPPTTSPPPTSASPHSRNGDTEGRLARRRKQCRVSQRRYRDKKGSAEYNLRLDVNSLRESVERLRVARQLLESRVWNDRLSLTGSVRKAVEQYYVMFSTGLYDPHADSRDRKCFDVQVGFLHAFLDQDVVFGDGKGISDVIEQWRRYSIFHEDMWVRSVSAQIYGTHESPIAVVQGLLGVRLNRTTIEAVFPHILNNEELVQALIGKEVVYDTCTTYLFNERNQVVRQDLEVDFLSGLAKLLNPTKTANVLNNAIIFSSSKLGEGEACGTSPPPSPVSPSVVDLSGVEPEPEVSFVFADDEYEKPRFVEIFEDEEEAAAQPVSRLALQYIMS
uniref:BZIP domain-containing protein n=1 Tax=Globisporangium ultimum (strain ATCC 200006 / CBS 805.95 / DAOM BR144) TaxID=431595 RepID=K3XAD5_GLOUD